MGSSGRTGNNKPATIRPELSRKLLSHVGCEKRIPNETAEAVSEVLRMFVIEARARATIEVSQLSSKFVNLFDDSYCDHNAKFLLLLW